MKGERWEEKVKDGSGGWRGRGRARLGQMEGKGLSSWVNGWKGEARMYVWRGRDGKKKVEGGNDDGKQEGKLDVTRWKEGD